MEWGETVEWGKTVHEVTPCSGCGASLATVIPEAWWTRQVFDIPPIDQRWWLPVACTDGLTAYFVHPKRGQRAMDKMAILPEFSGKVIHDGWKSYQGYEGEHFLCNAHHLRELRYLLEPSGNGRPTH